LAYDETSHSFWFFLTNGSPKRIFYTCKKRYKNLRKVYKDSKPVLDNSWYMCDTSSGDKTLLRSIYETTNKRNYSKNH